MSETIVLAPNGGDDRVVLQTLLDRGGDVMLTPGVFVLSAGLVLSNGQTLSGSGKNTVLRPSESGFTVVTMNSDRCAVRDLTIAGRGTIDPPHSYGVNMEQCAGCAVLNVSMSAVNIGVRCLSCQDTVVSGCRMDWLIGNVSGTGYGVLSITSDRLRVRESVFTSTPGNGRHAVYLSAASTYSEVRDCTVLGMNSNALKMQTYAAQGLGRHNRIVSNLVQGCLADENDSGAIGVYGAEQHAVVADNTVVETVNSHGIVVTDSGHGGLTVAPIVRHNLVRSSGLHGITIIGTKDAQIVGNHVSDNSALVAQVASGIHITSSGTFGTEVNANTRLTGNISMGAGQKAAVTVNSAVPVPTGVVLWGNDCRPGSSGAILLNGVLATIDGVLQ